MHSNTKKYGPLFAILFGFLFGSLILLITGRSPIIMFTALLRSIGISVDGFNAFNFGEFLSMATIIILTGLSVGFAFRAGMFNIGAEGQLMLGSLGAFLVALNYPDSWPPFFHMPASVLAAALFGAAWGAIPGFLKAKFKVHEVVVTIMLNYTALHLLNMIVRLPQYVGAHINVTRPVPESARLTSEFLRSLTTHGNSFSRLNIGIYIMIICVILYWIIIEKTSFGYRLRAIGQNPSAARYAGMKVELGMISSMAISGALAGLAGAVLVLGIFGAGRGLPAMEMYGFDGIAVALVGASKALGIFFAGLLFSMLKVAQPLMQNAGIPKEIASIIAATVVFMIAIQSSLFDMIFTKYKANFAKTKAEQAAIKQKGGKQ